MPKVSIFDPDINDDVLFDLDKPEQKRKYEEIKSKSKKESGERSTLDKIIHHGGSALMGGVVGGLTGGPVGAGLGAVTGGLFPPEDPVDLASMIVGGKLPAAGAKLGSKIAAKSGKLVNALTQGAGAMVGSFGENAIEKALRNPSQIMKQPSEALPSMMEGVMGATQGMLGAAGANMTRTPAAETNRRFGYGTKDPSKNAQLVREGGKDLDVIREERAAFNQRKSDLEKTIAGYETTKDDLSKRKIELETRQKKNELKQDYEKTNKDVVFDVADSEASTQKQLMQREVDSLKEKLKNLDSTIDRNIFPADYNRAKEQLSNAILQKEEEITTNIKKAGSIAVDKIQSGQIPQAALQSESTIIDNIRRIKKDEVDLNTAIRETRREIEAGEFGNAEIASIFRDADNAESIVERVLNKDPKTIKDFMNYMDSKGKLDLTREAILQSIVSKSYDPKTNSFGRGFDYLQTAGIGAPIERLAQIYGDVDKAKKLVSDFSEISEAAKRIAKNYADPRTAFTTATSLAFLMSGHNPEKAAKIAAGETMALSWIKWGTILNKMASSPKFNKAFKDWMDNGASTEVLKASGYLFAELRSMAHDTNFTASGNPY